MGQKVNPKGFRLAVRRDWESRWFANKGDYATAVNEDYRIREFLRNKLKNASVPRIFIERAGQRVRVKIFTARPGMVIGQKGASLETLKADLAKFIGKEVLVDIQEIKKPDLDAFLVAESIALQLERRISFRRAVKKAITTCMANGADGIKVQVAGRLGGAEIARVEWYREGRVPLHTLRADVDYGVATAHTAYGTCGVKVWIYKGEILPARKVKKGDAQDVNAKKN